MHGHDAVIFQVCTAYSWAVRSGGFHCDPDIGCAKEIVEDGLAEVPENVENSPLGRGKATLKRLMINTSEVG